MRAACYHSLSVERRAALPGVGCGALRTSAATAVVLMFGGGALNLNQLYYFVVTCESDNNMTKAAEHLVISQSAISYAVRNLEQEFHMKLFKRNGKSLELTDDGREFYRRASKIIGETRALGEYFHRGRPSSSGPVALGMTMLARNIFSKVLSRMGTSIPVTLDKLYVLQSEELFQALEGGTVDLVVVGTSHLDDYSAFEKEIIGNWRSSLYTPVDGPLARLRTVRIDQLSDVPLVIYLENSSMRKNYLDVLEEFAPGLDLCNVKGLASDLSSIVESIIHNGYSTIIGHDAIRDVPEICSIPIEGVLPYQIAAFWRKGEELSDPAKMLVDQLKAYLSEPA